MDSIAGMRKLRALSAVGNRETIAAALVETCLSSDAVSQTDVVFLSDSSSRSDVPTPVLLSLRSTRMPVVDTLAGGKTVLFVPLMIGDTFLAILKLKGRSPFSSETTCSFELLASYAAALLERCDLALKLGEANEKARVAELERRRFWDMLPAHAWLCEPNGNLVAVNEAFAEFFGLQDQKVSEFGYHNIFHPDDYERVMGIWIEAISKELPGQAESRMVGADGTVRTFLIRVVPIRDEDGTIIRWYGVNTDVDDLKLAQREIAKTAEALAEAQMISHTGSWSWRCGDDVFSCSTECARIFGLEPDDTLTFEAILARLHPQDRPGLDPDRISLDPSIQEIQHDLRVVLPSGVMTVVESRIRIARDDEARVTEYVGTVRDVTDYRLAQNRLQESERRYAATLSSIGDAVISADERNQLTFINPVAERLLGWNHEDAVGRPVEDVFRLGNPVRGIAVDPVSDVLRQEVDPAHATHYELHRRAGSDLVIEVSGAPIIDTAGDLKGAVIVFRDITQRIETEEALRRSNEDLARMARLTAVGELAVSIAHEINQPLMSIVTNAAASRAWLLNGDAPDIEEAVQAIGSVIEDGHRAGEVLRGIMTLARNARPTIETVSIKSVIDEVLQLAKSELRQRGVMVRIVIDGNADAVSGDRVQLQQVLINMLMNGADAMALTDPGQRIINVATERRSDGLTQISVSDNGDGLEPESAKRVFESFFTTKKTGIGMGLSICRSIIEAHGGRIWVESEPTRGTTFNFTLQTPSSPTGQTEALVE
jgi:PAS domain S-box-containing protein